MTIPTFAEYLITRTDWSRLQELQGDGCGVRDALVALLSAGSVEQAEEAYWRIENHAVAQGTVYEVAEACTSVLVASLMDQRARFIRISVLELLFQILNGSAAASGATPPDIIQRCRQSAEHGLWILIRECAQGESEAARDVLTTLGKGDHIPL